MVKDINSRNVSLGLLFAFLVNTFGPIPSAQAQEFVLPKPGTIVTFSPLFIPPLIRAMTIDPHNPLKFNFIIGVGNEHLSQDAFKKEAMKLIKYFFVSLTVPENEMWVNLSPYEKGRIVPEHLGRTEMGRNLLAEDYMLKQLTASLMDPQQKLGAVFWERLRQKAKEKFGTDNIPTSTYNKVWIVPDRARVFVRGQSVFVVESHLKVMLEEDYISFYKHAGVRIQKNEGSKNDVSNISKVLIREIIIPEIEKEVNSGRNFALLRQIQNASILAAWYKKNLRQTLLGRVYADKDKISGINSDDPQAVQKIYTRYIQAFKKGAVNLVKEEYDADAQGVIAREYFSGGFIQTAGTILDETSSAAGSLNSIGLVRDVSVSLQPLKGPLSNAAMLSPLEVLEKNDWAIKKSMGELGYQNNRRESFYDFFVILGLEKELKEKLLKALNETKWVVVLAGRKLDLGPGTVDKLIDDFQLEKPQKDKAGMLELLEANDWNIGKIKNELGIRPGESIYDFFISAGLKNELAVFLKREYVDEGLAVSAIGQKMGLVSSAVENLIAELEIKRPELTKAEKLKILDDAAWDIKKVRKQLYINSYKETYDFFEHNDLLPQLKERVLVVMARHAGSITDTANEFGISLQIMQRIMEKLGIKNEKITKEKMLQALEQYGWNSTLVNQRLALGLGKTFDVYQFLRDYDLIEDIKPRLTKDLKANKWSIARTAESYGMAFATMDGLIQKLGLAPAFKDKEELLAALEAEHWDLNFLKLHTTLSADGIAVFFYKYGLTPVLKAKIQTVIAQKNNSLRNAALELGLTYKVLKELTQRFALLTPEVESTKEEVLGILNANNWDIKETAEQLGIKIKGNPYWVDYFLDKYELYAEFEAKLTERLEANKWSIAPTAMQFGLGDLTVSRYMTKFNLFLSDERKSELLEQMEQSGWDLRYVKRSIADISAQTIVDYFTSQGAKDELRQKIIEELEANKWVMKDIFSKFHIGHKTFQRILELLEIRQAEFLKSHDEVLKLLQNNDWRIDLVRKELNWNGLGMKKSVYNFLLVHGVLDDFKEVFVQELERQQWRIELTANRFGITGPQAYQLIEKWDLKKNFKSKEALIAFLEANGWRLNILRLEIGQRWNAQGIYNYFKRFGLTEPLRQRINKTMLEEGSSVYLVAYKFGLSPNVLKGLMELLDYTMPSQSNTKEDILKALAEEHWNVVKVHEKLGLRVFGRMYALYDFFASYNLLEEARVYIRRELTESHWNFRVLGDVLGVGATSTRNLMARLGIRPSLNDKKEAIAFLEANHWDLESLKPFVVQLRVESLIEFFEKYQMIEEVKAKIISILVLNHGLINKSAEALNIGQLLFKRLISRLGIDEAIYLKPFGPIKNLDSMDERFTQLHVDGDLQRLIETVGVEGAFRVLSRIHVFTPLVLRNHLIKYLRNLKPPQRKPFFSRGSSFSFVTMRHVDFFNTNPLDFEDIVAQEIIRFVYLDIVNDHRLLGMFEQESRNPKNSPMLQRAYKKVYDYYDPKNFLELGSLNEDRVQLRYYQRKGAEFLIKVKKGILADEPGIGKTLQALTAALNIRDGLGSRKTLIIAPRSAARKIWEKEIESKTLNHGKVVVVDSNTIKTKKGRDLISEAKFVIVSYDTIIDRMGVKNALREELLKHHYDVVIVDEAHRTRNESLRTEAVRNFSAEYQFLITGTPLVGRSMGKMFNLLNWLYPELFPDRRDFDSRYTGTAENIRRLREDIAPFFLRRTQKDVMNLAPLHAVYIPVTLNPIQRAFYEQIQDDFADWLSRYDLKSRPNQAAFLAKLTKLRQAAISPGTAQDVMAFFDGAAATVVPYASPTIHLGGSDYQIQIDRMSQMPRALIDSREREFKVESANGRVWVQIGTKIYHIQVPRNIPSSKYEEAEKIVQNAVKAGEKVVIFSMFRQTVFDLTKRFQALGCNYLLGGMSEKEFDKQVKEFQTNPAKKIMVTTIGTGAEAIALTAANHVIFIDMPWNPQERDQSVRRLLRMLQEKEVHAYYLVASDTVDEDINAILMEGDLISHLAFDDDPILENLTDDLINETLKRFNYPTQPLQELRSYRGLRREGVAASMEVFDESGDKISFDNGHFSAEMELGSHKKVGYQSFKVLLDDLSKLSLGSQGLLKRFIIQHIAYDVENNVPVKQSLMWHLAGILVASMAYIDYHGRFEKQIEMAALITDLLVNNPSLTLEELINHVEDRVSLYKTLYFMDRHGIFKVLSALGVLDKQYYFNGELLEYIAPLAVSFSLGRVVYRDTAIVDEIAPGRMAAAVAINYQSPFETAAKRYRQLDRDEEIRLAREAQKGNEAATDALYQANLIYIFETVNKVVGGVRKTGWASRAITKAEIEDAYQEGARALLEIVPYYYQEADNQMLKDYAEEYVAKAAIKSLYGKAGLDLKEQQVLDRPMRDERGSASYLESGIFGFHLPEVEQEQAEDHEDAGKDLFVQVKKALMEADFRQEEAEFFLYFVNGGDIEDAADHFGYTIFHARDIINEARGILKTSQQFSALVPSRETDDAMLVANKGGIDLISNEKVLVEQGDKIKLPIVDAPLNDEAVEVNGFVPVIISIQPMSDIRTFLGLNSGQAQVNSG